MDRVYCQQSRNPTADSGIVGGERPLLPGLLVDFPYFKLSDWRGCGCLGDRKNNPGMERQIPGLFSTRLSGLNDLEAGWQELVLTLITTPPVNQIRKVASYMISPLDVGPVTSVERPLALAA